MVQPKDRGRKQKRVQTPGGRNVLRIIEAKKGKAHCAECHTALRGVVTGRKAFKFSKTEKRPEALFAGKLCNSCRIKYVEEALKVKTGVKDLNHINITYQKYVTQILNQIEKMEKR
ncbi:MAG: 50S ribosomal protein L34e [Candidatus Diapherotrites archaeon]|nr:50S ribosomal protein L34e [Candidatus Diapherotrites archaeon]